MGIDTVKLSYPGFGRFWREMPENGWVRTGDYGTVGPVWWCRYRHSDGSVEVTVKGVGDSTRMLWEGSVPKCLGLSGPATSDCVRLLDRHVRKLMAGCGTALGIADIRRLDATEDVLDADGSLRRAALGWNPHARSRYVQAVYQDCETVFQHNKTRGVRVYDKFAESGEPWAVGITRVEYQIRGDWVDRYGLLRVDGLDDRAIDAVIAPLVADLRNRAGLTA